MRPSKVRVGVSSLCFFELALAPFWHARAEQRRHGLAPPRSWRRAR